MTWRSEWHTPAPPIFTSTWPGPADGLGTSSIWSRPTDANKPDGLHGASYLRWKLPRSDRLWTRAMAGRRRPAAGQVELPPRTRSAARAYCAQTSAPVGNRGGARDVPDSLMRWGFRVEFSNTRGPRAAAEVQRHFQQLPGIASEPGRPIIMTAKFSQPATNRATVHPQTCQPTSPHDRGGPRVFRKDDAQHPDGDGHDGNLVSSPW